MSDVDDSLASPPPMVAEQDDDMETTEPREGVDGATAEDLSEAESDALSEIDENQLEDYDPETADIEDKPIAVDEEVAKSLKASRRKPTGDAPKKPKEMRREKKRQRPDAEEADDAGEGASASRKRRGGGGGEGRSKPRKATPEPENEDNLTPEERRKRAIERALDAALKKPKTKRKRKDEEDLDDEFDDKIAWLNQAMSDASVADNESRLAGRPATEKLKLMPEVLSILNRQSIQHLVVDPETGFLKSVRFFLEPLRDTSLPAYNIQRDLFKALQDLPIGKEALSESGLGKLVYFYTISKQPDISIKRMAHRLMGEWSRPLLRRTDDYRKRHVETRTFDYNAHKAAQRQSGFQTTLSQRPTAEAAKQAERDRALAQKTSNNRARPAGLPDSYSIAPVSTFDPSSAPDHRPIGASGEKAFRKMTQKAKKR